MHHGVESINQIFHLLGLLQEAAGCNNTHNHHALAFKGQKGLFFLIYTGIDVRRWLLKLLEPGDHLHQLAFNVVHASFF